MFLGGLVGPRHCPRPRAMTCLLKMSFVWGSLRGGYLVFSHGAHSLRCPVSICDDWLSIREEGRRGFSFSLLRPVGLLLGVGTGFLTVFVEVLVAVLSFGEDLSVVVVALFLVLALAGLGFLDHRLAL